MGLRLYSEYIKADKQILQGFNKEGIQEPKKEQKRR
jgi:hypothetical protein